MKKKIFIPILITLIGFLYNPSYVHAFRVVPRIQENINTGITWRSYGTETELIDENGGHLYGEYEDHTKVGRVNGRDYLFYCLDPGLKFRSNTEYICEQTTDPGFDWLLSSNSSLTYTERQLAVRIYASYVEIGNSNLSNMKGAIIRFRQIQDGLKEHVMAGCAAAGVECSDNAFDYLAGADGVVSKAGELAKLSYEKHREAGRNVEQNADSQFNFRKINENENTITYSVTSTETVSEIEFRCTENCYVSSQSWNGTSGTVIVQITPNCEPYTIEYEYTTSGGIFVCYPNVTYTNYQWLITKIDGGEITGTFQDAKEGCGLGCCTPGVVDDHIVGNINNCCEDGQTNLTQYALDDLFCYDSNLNISYYKDKCDNEHYLDHGINSEYLNDYCLLYCTERISIDLPGAITAESGRYFTLRQNDISSYPISGTSQGTTFSTSSPYINGVKRCRMKVFYDQWEEDYYAKVREEIQYYNEFQEKKAWELLYENVSVTARESATTATCSCSCKITKSCVVVNGCEKKDANGNTVVDRRGNVVYEDCEKSFDAWPSTSNSQACTIKYNVYNFSTASQYSIRKVKLSESTMENHTALNILYDSANSSATNKTGNVVSDINDDDCDVTAYNNLKTNGRGKKATHTDPNCRNSENKTSWDCWCDLSSCSYNGVTFPHPIEGVAATKSSYASAASTANTKFKTAAAEAENLELALDRCNYFFTKYEGYTTPSKMYDFDPTVVFSYQQNYLDEYGRIQTDKVTKVYFEDNPGCVVSGPIVVNSYDGEIREPQYSYQYGGTTSKYNAVTDFNNTDLSWKGNTSGTGSFADFFDTTYNAEKRFAHDAKYEMNCAWEEKDNVINTLVPSGEVSESTTKNFTKHNKEYTITITTTTGTYDTEWLITGVGENSKFDEYIKNNTSETCSDTPLSENNNFACKIHIINRIIDTGECGDDGEVCDPEPVYNFKVVDPKEFFPTSSSNITGEGIKDSNGEFYAYNWVVEEKGKKVMAEINKKAENNSTYSPKNISYSFRLSPSDMVHIKNYNEERNDFGGYNDFELECVCSTVIQTNSMENGVGCVKCKSTFIDNLENGYIKYSNRSFSVDVWSSNKTLDTIRKEYKNWAGA